MSEKIFNSFDYKNDLSDFELEYVCSEPCQFMHCPGHRALFQQNTNSDTYGIHFFIGEEREYAICLDSAQMALIEEFIIRMKKS